MLLDRVYPVYAKASTDGVEALTDGQSVQSEEVEVEEVFRNLDEALSTERTRQWGSKEPQISDDPEAAHLQKVGHDVPKTVEERVVKKHRHRKLLEMPPCSDKVH